ncbi:TRAP transporter small permease [Chloroflexota bacterium]
MVRFMPFGQKNYVLRRLWRWFEKFSAFLYWFATILGVSILVAMTGLILVNTLSRTIVVLPIGWLEDVVTVAVAWSVFLLLGPVAKRDSHIRVGFFMQKVLGIQRASSAWRALECVFGFGIAAYLSYYGYYWLILSYDMHTISYSAGGFWYPVWITRTVVPMGMGILAFLYLSRGLCQLASFMNVRASSGQALREGEIAEKLKEQGIHID